MMQTSKIAPSTNECQSLFYVLLIASVLLFLTYFFAYSNTKTTASSTIPITFTFHYRRRPECSCSRPELPRLALPIDQVSLCNDYATHRGKNQRIIAISLFGPKENKMFNFQKTLNFLQALINDTNQIYSDNFTLRVYHDETIKPPDVICPIECEHPNVDFCDMSSKLFIPPKIWRFIPAADPLVDIMMSRDLDSSLTQRERAAVNEWLASNKSFHSMRDHPQHGVPVLGGMWAFRPPLNPKISRMFYDKIHNKALIEKYGAKNDQTFLANEIWPHVKSDAIAHDSFLCKTSYGHKSVPFPTQRQFTNDSDCFIGCVRPCCRNGVKPFGECPIECRPKDHQDWIYC